MRTAFAGDIVFVGVTPVMWAGPVERWLAALERLVDTGADRFVPGHGPLCGVAEIERLADYWRWLEAGPSPREIVDAFVRMALLARDREARA